MSDLSLNIMAKTLEYEWSLPKSNGQNISVRMKSMGM